MQSSIQIADVLKLDLLKLGILLFAMGGGYAKLQAHQKQTKDAVSKLQADAEDFVRKDVAEERNARILEAFEDQNRRLERIEAKLDKVRR